MSNAFIYRYNRDAPGKKGATHYLIFVTIAVTALQFLTGGMEGEGHVYTQGILLAGPVWNGEAWRLLSYALLHGGLLHIFMNMYFIFSLGKMYEDAVGAKAFLLVYIVSAICGGVAVMLFGSYLVGVVGASGGAFGLLGAVLATMYVRLGSVGNIWRSPMGQHLMVVTGLMLLAGLHPAISGLGHAGGLIGGILIGYLVARYKSRGLEPLEKVGAVVCAVLILAVAAYSTMPMQRGAWRLNQAMKEMGLEVKRVQTEEGRMLQVARTKPTVPLENLTRAQELAKAGFTDPWDGSETYTFVASRVSNIINSVTERQAAKSSPTTDPAD